MAIQIPSEGDGACPGLSRGAQLPLADPKRSRISEIPVMGKGSTDRTRNPVGRTFF